MSKFIDKLNRLSRAEPLPMGFRAVQPTSPRLKIQLVASLPQESVESLTDSVTGADAGLLSISKLSSAAKTLNKIAQGHSDILWGGRLESSRLVDVEQILKAGCDFIVFPATSTSLAIAENDEVGKILEVEASLSEGLLRAVNELPVDAVLIASEQKEGHFLSWQHLMLFRRFADLLTKPLLASIPSTVTVAELQALWAAGVEGVVVEVTVGQPQDRLKELRQAIDKLAFPSPRRHDKAEPRLPRISREQGMTTIEEEEEDEE
ncbi:MAG: hypothetical protein HYU85_02290 [Chloroflexi bacterium]|nr:hypothetical protein [Chloroflexota bacterium]